MNGRLSGAWPICADPWCASCWAATSALLRASQGEPVRAGVATTEHPGRCGPCPDCAAALRDYEVLLGRVSRLLKPSRDPLLSFGIPPKLNQKLQRSRVGGAAMFERPARHKLANGAKPHWVVSVGGKATLPTLPLDVAALVRHAQLFGDDQVTESAEGRSAELELGYLYLGLEKLRLEKAKRAENASRKGRRRFTPAPRRTKRYGRRAEHQATVRALRQEGLPSSEIADRLGLSIDYIDRLTA